MVELVLLGTAGGPMPVPGRAGISSALVVDGRVILVDCGRGAPSRFVDEALDPAALELVLLTHLHADHTGDLPGVLLYLWGARRAGSPPIEVHGPGPARIPPNLRAGELPVSDLGSSRPEASAAGTEELVQAILRGWSHDLQVMPLDTERTDPAGLVRGRPIASATESTTVIETAGMTVSTIEVRHGHVDFALAYRIDTGSGSVVFAGDCAVDDRLAGFAEDADILVHSVADFGRLEAEGASPVLLERARGMLTGVDEVGAVAERAKAKRLVLTHYLPSDPLAITPEEWASRAALGYSGEVIAGYDGLRVRLAPAEGRPHR